MKRLDSIGSHRASAEFLGALRTRTSSTTTSSSSSSSAITNSSWLRSSKETAADETSLIEEEALGNRFVDVVAKVANSFTGDSVDPGENESRSATNTTFTLDANEIEAISMIRVGFENLIASNPSLGWSFMSRLIEGASRSVDSSKIGRSFVEILMMNGVAYSDDALRSSIIRSTPTLSSVAPSLTTSGNDSDAVKSIIRRSMIMTDRGPAVLLPPERKMIPFSESDDEEETSIATQSRDDPKKPLGEVRRIEEEKSPIAQMLYSRWLMSLKEQCEPLSRSLSFFLFYVVLLLTCRMN